MTHDTDPTIAPLADIAGELIKHEERRDRARGCDTPQWCSNCTQPAADAHSGFTLSERKDNSKMLFCSLRCVVLWGISRGWRR